MDLFESLIGSKIIPSGGGGGGAALNIAYGQEAPSDTSKIWIKAEEPESLEIKGANLTKTDITSIVTGEKSNRWNTMSYLGFWKDSIYYTVMTYNTGTVYGSNTYYPHFVSFNPETGNFSDLIDLSSFLSTNSGACFCWFMEDKNKVVVGKFSSDNVHKAIQFDFNDRTVIEEYTELPSTISSSYFNSSVLYNNTIFGFSSGTVYKLSLDDFSYYSTPVAGFSSLSGIVFNYGNIVFFIDSANNKIGKYNLDTGDFVEYEVYDSSSRSTIPQDSSLIFTLDGSTLYLTSGRNSYKNILYKLDLQDNSTYSISILSDSIFDKAVKGGRLILYKNQCFVLFTTYYNGDWYFNKYIYKLIIDWSLEENKGELYITNKSGNFGVPLLDSSGIKQEVNSAKYFYGDESGKATSAPVYYHNGTDWVEFT